MPRQKKEKGQLRHEPLGKQIQQDEDSKLMAAPRTVKREKQHRQQRRQKEEGFIPTKLSSKALDLAREQREEEEKESVDFEINNMERSEMRRGAGGGGRGGGYVSSDDEDYNFDDEEDYEVEDIEISEEDAQALSLWMGPQGPPRTIADLIMEKIKEKEMMLSGALPPEKRLDPKVVEVFTGVGALLARYRSGRLPKAFKLVPSLANWEEILYITNPDGWSPQAVRAATKIFASNLNAKMAQRYYNIILLPHIRNDIEEHKKLNWHLYMALKKSVFKPAAFYKGIVLPLCESRTCTLREATIVGSIMVKCSIPSLHSAVALLKIAEMEYSGANSIFIRILLDKKYALPYRVVDSLITHFTAFVHADKRLPVLWHQALLVFVQRYKELMTVQQKEEIKRLVRAQTHPAITPEIHRELQHSKSRGEVDMKDVTKPQFNPFGGAM